MKCYMTQIPYLTIILALCISVVFFGAMVVIFERPYPDTVIDNMENGMWLIIVTMTTVGYGDMFPQTHLGRVLATMACIVGVFLLSSFVVSIVNNTQLEAGESKAAGDLVELKYNRPKLYMKAVKLIQRWTRMNSAISVKSSVYVRIKLRK